MTIWHSGEWKSDAPGAGVLSGWGVFTTLGVWNGRAFAVEEHLARLRGDALRSTDDPASPISSGPVALSEGSFRRSSMFSGS